MKNKRQAGQAIILALILLAIGATMLVPALGLSSTSLKSSQVVTQRTRLLYAADAMQEYVMWKLVYDTAWRDANLGADGATGYLSIDLCGIGVNATVVMRAVPGQGGITLATDDVIQPTKTVTASNPISTNPLKVANDSTQIFTYIIRLEQLSNNNTQGLDAIYDILPTDFGTNKYVPDSSYIRVDGGAWQSIGDPSRPGQGSNPSGSYGGQERLRWPYSGNFSSDPASPNYYYGMRNFNVRQIKELKFQVSLTLPNNADDRILYNYAVIKTGNITTFSGPQAPIVIGDGSKGANEGMLTVTKTSSPNIIMPGVVQNITYTINVSNNDTETHDINEITDYLPPEFFYVENSTIGFGDTNPTTSVQNINGVTRQVLVWTPIPSEKQIASGTTRTLTFLAGSYYNEVLMQSSFQFPQIFSDIGVTPSDFTGGYSWNSGTVIVPAYDSSANASGVVVNANLALRGLSSILINSYQIR